MPTVHTATITRTELSLSTLTLIDSTYDIMNQPGLDGGRVSWRRENAASPYVAGVTEIGSVKDDVLTSLVMRVTGASHSDVQTKVSTLISAFSQKTYTLTIGLDGTSWAWACRRADYAISFDLPMRWQKVARVALSIPRSPVPTSGPY